MTRPPRNPLSQLGLLLPGSSEWPSHSRFPFNHGIYRVGAVLEADLRDDPDPLLITGYTSLDRLISFLAERHREHERKPGGCIRILLGAEPVMTSRRPREGPDDLLDPIRAYWMEQGISVYRCAEVIRAVELLRSGGVTARTSGGRRVHAKIYVTRKAVLLGSSNFSDAGLSLQQEANIRIGRDEADYANARCLAEAIWSTGRDYTQALIRLLGELLTPQGWEEALATACAAVLGGEVAQPSGAEGRDPGVELWPSQVQGVKQALWVLQNAGSVLVADATGSGKTRTGAQLIRAITNQRARRGRAGRAYPVLVCPPKVRAAWQREATLCRLAIDPVSQGVVSIRNAGAHHLAIDAIRRADILAVDEAHNYLNRTTTRTQTLYANRADHIILFTATPINRGTHDLLAIVDMLGADNFDEAVIELVRKLWVRTRRGGAATEEELLVLRRGIQQFTVRRTKTTFNRIIAEDPRRYRNALGELCQYPQHVADDYPGGETTRDREIAREIQEVAIGLRGLSWIRRLHLPQRALKHESEGEFLNRRLRAARGLAQYHVRETLRSSRVALAEHLFGTQAAAAEYGIARAAKRRPSGDVIGRLREWAGRPPRSNLAELPAWLASEDEHRAVCDQEIRTYQRIGELLREMSPAREERKMEVIRRLMGLNRLVLAFDRHVLTLRYFEAQLKNEMDVVVATGGDTVRTNSLNALFRLESDAEGVLALCSDAMSEGVNLQAASAMVLLDLPSVIRVIEQRIGRIDRMDSPHPRIQVLWPNDSAEFALHSDDLLVSRHNEVDGLLGSNILLPEDLRGGRTFTGSEVREIVETRRRAREEELELLGDAFNPVRELVEGNRALVPAEVFGQVESRIGRAGTVVSVVPAEQEWTFFALRGTDQSSVRWVLLDVDAAGRRSEPRTDFLSIAARLRERLRPGGDSHPPDEEVAERVRLDLGWLVGRERMLLSRRKQRALTEMEWVLRQYRQSGAEAGGSDGERRAVSDWILRRLEDPEGGEAGTTVDWERVADWWMDVIRLQWHGHLSSRARIRPARLRDLRGQLIAEPLASEALATARAEVWEIPDLGRRLVVAIVGVARRG